MPVTGPDFISLQARDLAASQAFYEQYLGLVRSPAGPPHAVVFETKPIAFALRDVVPGTDLASVAQPGIGAAIWLHATDVQAIHDALVAAWPHHRRRADRRPLRPDVHLRRPRRLPGHPPRPRLTGRTGGEPGTQCGAPTSYSGRSLSTRTVTFLAWPPICTVQSKVVPFWAASFDGHCAFFTSGSP